MALSPTFVPADGSLMRRAMGRFLTGAAVVTAEHDGERTGMTINSLTSISLEPPILMISLNFGTRTGDALLASGKFAISILGQRQEAVARQFAVRGGARFAEGTFDTTPSGLPVVAEALSQIECEVSQTLVVGDHQVFFGTVTNCRFREGLPLAFNSGRFGGFVDSQHEDAPWLF